MFVPFSGKLFLFAVTALFIFTTVPVSAHDLAMGGSRWCFGKNGIQAAIELGSGLIAEIKGIKEGGYYLGGGEGVAPDLMVTDSLIDEQLQQMATGIIQPYIDEKLSISINGKVHPVKVNKIAREGILWKIWLSVDDISFNKYENKVKIDYQLLFNETDNAHVNVGFLYLYDATADSVQKVFDHDRPSTQTNFDHNATSWEVFLNNTENGLALVDKTASPVAGTGSVWANAGQFISLGVEHILIGYDHIAFLLALIVIGLSFKEALKIITAFTVAHSVTLLLAALQIVSLNSRFVEIVIALSICYVAVENLLVKKVKYRWILTFVFGLIHGFGFASVLQDFIRGKSNLVLSVLSFNIGVEVGQLMILIVMLPVLYLLRNKFEFRRVTAVTSVAILIMGFTWLIERLFDLELLWF
jgi:hydrogenase/urease accessory protein HupE